MKSTTVILPLFYKKYLRYSSARFSYPLPGIQIKKSSRYIKVSIYETTLPVHCQSDKTKATLQNALQSLQSISKLFPPYKAGSRKTKTKQMVEEIGKPLRDYLLFESDKDFEKYFFLHTTVWLLLLVAVSVLVLSGLTIPFVAAIYLMMLVPVSAACLGFLTGFFPHREFMFSQLEKKHKKLVAAIERVNNKIFDLSEEMNKQIFSLPLDIIEEMSEQSSNSSVKMTNDNDFSNNRHSVYPLKRTNNYSTFIEDEAKNCRRAATL